MFLLSKTSSMLSEDTIRLPYEFPYEVEYQQPLYLLNLPSFTNGFDNQPDVDTFFLNPDTLGLPDDYQLDAIPLDVDTTFTCVDPNPLDRTEELPERLESSHQEQNDIFQMAEPLFNQEERVQNLERIVQEIQHANTAIPPESVPPPEHDQS